MTDIQTRPQNAPETQGEATTPRATQGEATTPPATPRVTPAAAVLVDADSAEAAAAPEPSASTLADAAPSMVESRLAIIEAAIRVFRRTAFHETTLATVAEEAGLPEDDLRHHFPSWDGLVLATVDRWNGARLAPLLPVARSHGTIRFLRSIVADNVADPALMRFLVALLSVAAMPGHPLAPLLQHRYQQFHMVVQDSLVADVAVHREPSTMEPRRGAEQLIALYEGLQLQSMVRPSLDLLAAYDRAITRLRDGWSQQYVPPVWEIN